ncbi:Rho GTPase activator [Grosmannia clavigera kw1407]|uniref:Rho GTPase activator n=1 Tax=Grosmannia clavigera (strain kw1407 / UAMH 11150) TaxID=655863 RepID=F0XGX2_GROCL|nr:Rho GTPase activator [Grosmannia clavigera kw1407]EFX03214.1 Rho GTPase activator [Grosmannia clavigera kw1407]
MTTTAPAPSPSLASTQPHQPHLQPQPQLQPPPPSHQQQQPQLPQQPQQQLLLRQQHHHLHLPPPPPFAVRPQPAPVASTGPLQPLTPNVLHPPKAFVPPAAVPNPTSPPNKRDLKSWWKGFILQSKSHDVPMQRTRGIFGVPLRESITYANVAISLIDDNGRSYIYGYVPIVVAKCGVFLKEKATGIEGIFRLSGSEKRIKELKQAFDSPERYGKGMSWNGYTVHDAANVLRRYLNDLPEPVVPLDFYEPFRDPLRHAVKLTGADSDGPHFVPNFDMASAIRQYQRLITELPPLNRQLLLYILDLLAVFAAKSDVNRMNSQNLSAIFQPGLLSHPSHDMAPEEYRLNQIVLIFLIENQDHFLIGMQGTAADEQTVKDVQRGTPPVTPSIAVESPGAIGVSRTASNASAGAESVARDGKIRRNRSTSSRNSRHSNGNSNSHGHGHNHNHNHDHGHSHVAHTRPPSPSSSSPGLIVTPTASSSTSGGLARSNTLPARSPGLSPGRFNKRTDATGSPVSPLTPITHHSPLHTPTIEPVEEVVTPAEESSFQSPFSPAAVKSTPPPSTSELVLDPPPDTTGVPAVGTGTAVKETGASTPSKDRILSLFQRSQVADGEPRPPPNKLRKKRMPTSANPSAQSSTASLPPVASAFASSTHELGINPSEAHATASPSPAAAVTATAAVAATKGRIPPNELTSHQKSGSSSAPHAIDLTPHASQVPSTVTTTSTPMPIPAPDAAACEAQLRPQRRSLSPSLHSSFNDGSEADQADESTAASTSDHADHSERANKRNWRMSRRRDDAPLMGLLPPGSNLSEVSTNSRPALSVGSNANAELSTSSVCSAGPASISVAALSQTGASGSPEPTFANAEATMSQDSTTTAGSSRDGRDGRDGRDNKEGKLSGWLKNKYREAKETAEHRRTKSPTSEDRLPTTSLVSGLARGKSLDLKRPVEEDKKSN